MLKSGTAIPAENAEIYLYDAFLGQRQADQLFDEIFESTPWRQDRIKLYGRDIAIPRLQAWYGDADCSYSYSGIKLSPLEWTASLHSVRQLVEQAIGASFNSVLINLYRDGQDSNGWHADNEPELGAEPVIASLSLGGVRRFRLRKNSDRSQTIALDLNPGSLLVMAGSTQRRWQHCVTKTAKRVKPRINLTFRYTESQLIS